MSDGEDVISDYVAAAGTFSLQANYVQSLSIDSKLARIDASGTATFYLPDALGSVGVIADANGRVLERRLTNAWGEDILLPGPDRYGFTQRERMAEIAILGGTPAMHHRARTYFPEIGRLGQREPLLAILPFEHYRHAANNPLRFLDPTGFQPENNLAGFMKGVTGRIEALGRFIYENGVRFPQHTANQVIRTVQYHREGIHLGAAMTIAWTENPTLLGAPAHMAAAWDKQLTYNIKVAGDDPDFAMFYATLNVEGSLIGARQMANFATSADEYGNPITSETYGASTFDLVLMYTPTVLKGSGSIVSREAALSSQIRALQSLDRPIGGGASRVVQTQAAGEPAGNLSVRVLTPQESYAISPPGSPVFPVGNSIQSLQGGQSAYFISDGVRRAMASLRAGLDDIPAVIVQPGQADVLTRIPLSQLHSPKAFVVLNQRFTSIRPPIRKPIEVQPFGMPGQPGSIPLPEVKLVPP
jgi:RHS repeat-associated protein